MEYLRWHSNISLISLNSLFSKWFLNQKSVFLDVLDSLYSLEFSFSWSFIFGHKSSKFSVTFHIIVLTRARWSTLFFYSLTNKLLLKLSKFKWRLWCIMPELTFQTADTLAYTNRHAINSILWRYSDICNDCLGVGCVKNLGCLTGDKFDVTMTLGRKWFLKSSKSNKLAVTEWYTGLLTWQYKPVLLNKKFPQ